MKPGILSQKFSPTLFAGVILAASAICFSEERRGPETANGGNVVLVSYDAGARNVGIFAMNLDDQSKPTKWIERNPQGVNYFEEDSRDEWSVFLVDRTRAMSIQLDLHRKMILIRENPEADFRPLYEIKTAETLSQVRPR